MHGTTHQPTEKPENEDAQMTKPSRKILCFSDIRRSVCIAFALLAWDAVFDGSYLMSLCICPIWLLFSLLINAIRRPGWRIALLRIAIPPLTLGLVMANNAVQLKIARVNASQIIVACEAFHNDNNRFPKTLDELVPRYIPAIPRAKYCLAFGEFRYWGSEDDHPILVWYVVPPYGRKIYDFDDKRWNYID
jgi:hypothetical protein